MEAKNQIPSRLFYAEVAGPICKRRNVLRVFVCVCAAHCFMLCFVGFRLELTLPSKGVSHLFMTNMWNAHEKKTLVFATEAKFKGDQ